MSSVEALVRTVAASSDGRRGSAIRRTTDPAEQTGPMAQQKSESAEQDSYDPLVAKAATAIMMAVNGSGVLKGADDVTIAHATCVVHGELKALLEGKDGYRNVLKGIADGNMGAAHGMILVITTCTEKIAIFRAVGIELTPEQMREIRHDLGLSANGMAIALRLGVNGEKTVRRFEAGATAPSGPVTLLYEAYEDGRLRPPGPGMR